MMMNVKVRQEQDQFCNLEMITQDGQINATVIIEWLFRGADHWEINFL